MDYTKTGQLLDNILFVDPNETVSLLSTDLVNLAQILDQNLPLGTTDPTPCIATITNALAGNLQTLTQEQILNSSKWFLAYREPPIVINDGGST